MSHDGRCSNLQLARKRSCAGNKLQLPQVFPRTSFFSFSQTTMASHGADAGSSKPIASSEEQQGERKPAAVSFGFTKTASKFKPLTSDAQAKKDDRDYLTGIHGNELQRSAFSANANITFRCHLPVTFLILASHCNYCAFWQWITMYNCYMDTVSNAKCYFETAPPDSALILYFGAVQSQVRNPRSSSSLWSRRTAGTSRTKWARTQKMEAKQKTQPKTTTLWSLKLLRSSLKVCVCVGSRAVSTIR